MSLLLIVDDNKSVRESLRFLLLRRGYEVVAAASGPEALALASERPVDGAMIDVNMPGMNGLEVCRALREQAERAGRKLPVWMMTGARTPGLARRSAECGALVLLGKPFDLADLYARIAQEVGAGSTPPPDAPSAPASPPPSPPPPPA
jgi:CheY-like chemotaxis protein